MKVLFILALFLIVLAEKKAFFKVNIDKIGYEKLLKIKSLFKEPEYTIEIGTEMLVFASQQLFDQKIGDFGIEYNLITSNIENPNINILRHQHFSELSKLENVQILSSQSGYVVLHSEGKSLSDSILTFQPNMVLVRQTENDNITFTKTKNSTILKMIEFIKENSGQWFEEVKALARFNRFSYGSQISKSKDYILGELQKLGKYNVTLEQYNLGGTKMWNIIAELKGTTDELYLMCAHLDSTSNGGGVERVSPGAVDDASGSAALIEMAKVFAKFTPKKTLQLIWFTGEEQGLVGSNASAGNVVSRGDKNKVKIMIQMDMTGWKRDSSEHVVLLETTRTYSNIVKVFQEAAVKYCDDLKTAVSYSPFGSDHVPYLNRGMPAILTIDNDYARYPHYHRTTDSAQYVIKKQGIEIMKLNVAAMAHFLGYEDL